MRLRALIVLLLSVVWLPAGCNGYAVAPPAPSFLPDRFVATGTEPFWTARVEPNLLVYSTPEDFLHDPDFARRKLDAYRTDYPGRSIILAQLQGQELELTIMPGDCTDGMSDKVYPYAAIRRLGSRVDHGCAEPAAR